MDDVGLLVVGLGDGVGGHGDASLPMVVGVFHGGQRATERPHQTLKLRRHLLDLLEHGAGLDPGARGLQERPQLGDELPDPT